MSRNYINNEWLFAEKFKEKYILGNIDENMTEVKIPHTAKELPFNYFSEEQYQMLCAYRKEIFAPNEWESKRGGASQRLSTRIFLEWGERFDWPDPSLPALPEDSDLFCYGLRDQIGVLCDGTVVPCCLDSDANLALGNLFDTELEAILNSPRARAIYDGFTRHVAVEPLCRRCGYAAVIKKLLVRGKE